MSVAYKPIRLRRVVRKFAEEMELKLRDNDHKTHWQESTLGYLTGRIYDELKEFEQAKYPLDRMEELVDIANFCMMVRDKIDWISRGRIR